MRERGEFLRKELVALLGFYSRKGASNTPEHILADYLIDCLAAFDKAVMQRTEGASTCRPNSMAATTTPGAMTGA